MFHKENPDYNRKQVGFYTLDDLIPADHLLRQIDQGRGPNANHKLQEDPYRDKGPFITPD